MKSLYIGKLSKRKRKRILGAVQLGNKDHIPAHLIGQLGRCDRFTRDDLDGKTIISECLHKIYESKRISGGRIVVVECRQPLIKFYENNGFTLISNDNGLYQLLMRIE